MTQSLPSEDDQRNIIAGLEASLQLTPGSEAYVISTKWLNTWKRAVGFACMAPLRVPVPAIDNNILFNGLCLYMTLREGVDFFILAKPVWEQLFAWYGGGPIIAREVERNPMTGECEVVVVPPRYYIFWRNEKRPFPFSHLKTVGDLKMEACRIFGCDGSRSRLVDFDQRERGMLLEDHRSMVSYQFFDEHFLLLEDQRDDGKWISVEHRANRGMVSAPSMETVFAMTTEAGLGGFANIGNSCYMNTALQCLAHTDAIIDNFVRSLRWIEDRNMTNPIGTQCEVVDEFVALLKEMWNGDNARLSPRSFKFTVGKYAKQFAGQTQQDGAEFLTILLDLIHEDLNRVIRKPPVVEVFGELEDDAKTADAAWEQHKRRNDSIIVDNFHGQLRSVLTCPNCHRRTIVFDPYAALTLPLPVPRVVSPPLIFVPYDINEPRIQMRLTVMHSPTLVDYVDALSRRLGRHIHSLVFAERDPSTAIYLNWKPTLRPNTQCYAYEIPPHSSESVFACVRLTATRKFDALESISTEVDGIFLVELPDENASKDTVLEACQHRFESLWTASDGPLSPELVEFKDNLAGSSRYTFDDGERMKVVVDSQSFDSSVTFDRERNYRFLTSRPIQVVLNPTIIKDEMKFNWSVLRRLDDDPTPCFAEMRQSVPLDVALNMFSSGEVLDASNQWFCPHCRNFVCATKKMDVWRLPKVLVLHFKRFVQTASGPFKLDTKVECPLVLDMADYTKGPCTPEASSYKMFASMHHSGGLSGGHYVARAFHAKTRRWYTFDDGSVKPGPPTGNHSTDAYVVLYARSARKKPSRKHEKAPIEVTKEMRDSMFIPKIIVDVIPSLREDAVKQPRRRNTHTDAAPPTPVAVTPLPHVPPPSSRASQGIPAFFVQYSKRMSDQTQGDP